MGFQRKQSVNYIPQADLPLAIREAERIIELYKTRDPFEIIDCRKIKLRFTDRFFNLLGYFVVKHKQAYIGINAKVDEATQRTVAAHELAHAIMHYLEAAKKNGGFQDTMLFSLATGKMEHDEPLRTLVLRGSHTKRSVEERKPVRRRTPTAGRVYTGVVRLLCLSRYHSSNQRRCCPLPHRQG